MGCSSVFACIEMSMCVQLFVTLWTVAEGSSVHGTLQARMLECVAMSSSRGSSCPGDQTQVSCIAGGFLLAGI